MSVQAPFNFIPLSDKVYTPDWAELISHDMPFSDGVSGRIQLTIEAKTDIFVRNGQGKIANDNSFSQVSDRYFIPATSIKGEVRNLLEIMSFGKMSLDPRAKFAQREWNNANLYTIKSATEQQNIHCGYLRKSGDGYQIVDHGRPLRISHKEIDSYFGGKVLESHFKRGVRFDLNKEVEEDKQSFDPKTAVYKYHLFQGCQLKELSFSQPREQGAFTYVECDDGGNIHGDIVFTGQPDKWSEQRGRNAGKFYEFVFPANKEGEYSLSEEEFEHYEFIYADSPDWAYWKPQLEDSSSKGIPVFFRIKNSKVKDFGLALLYKLPYDNTPQDLLPKQHKGNAHDLAECIFGYTDGSNSLKGRVHFSNAFSDDAKPSEEVTLVLGTPKASYYPIYIEQDGNNGRTNQYRTYNDGSLSGWKRYHVRDKVWQKSVGSEKLDSKLIPVKGGATFGGEIVFHNLRPIELGALLSALTFHNNAGHYYHLLGQAKPYGYGRCLYSITLEGEELADVNYYMGCFEHELNKKLGITWHETPQITELFALAGTPANYRYMEMSTTGGSNEFLEAKGDKQYLPRFSKLVAKPASGPQNLSERFEQEEKMHKLEAIQTDAERCFAKLGQLPPAEAIQKAEEEMNRLKENMIVGADHDIYALCSKLWDKFEAKRPELQEALRAQQQVAIQAQKSAEIYEAGLSALLSTTKSPEANINGIKRWLEAIQEQEQRNTLNADEITAIVRVLQGSYDTAKSKERKKWKGGTVHKKATEMLGAEIADFIFNQLSIK